jgi:hypothetical protein
MDPDAALAPEASAATVIAYYFHRTVRCHTCLTIESYAQEALRTHFAADLAEGRLVWLPLNIEEEGNEHFEEDFRLEGSSLVLARRVGDKIVGWQNLPGIWDHVDQKNDFLEYVRASVIAALNGKIRKPGTDEH